MAVDFNILARVPTIGSQIMAGQEAGREAAARNMLLQQRQLEFEQAQEDRQRRLREERIFEDAAQMIRQSGLDPEDPKVLQQFTAAAVQSRNPQLMSLATSMSERLAKRRQERADAAAVAAIAARRRGEAPAGAPAPAAAAELGVAPMAAPVAAAAPQELSALAVEQAAQPRPEFYGQGTFAGTAPTAVTSPVGEFPTEPAPRVNAMAPVAPVVNRMMAAPAPAPAVQVAGPAAMPAAPKVDVGKLQTQLDTLQEDYDDYIALGTEAGRKAAAALKPQMGRLERQIRDANKTKESQSPLMRDVVAFGFEPTPEGLAKFEAAKRDPDTVGTKEYNLAVRQGFKGTLFDYKRQLAEAGRSIQTTQLVQEKAESAKYGERLIKEYDQIDEIAKLAARTLPSLESQEKLLNEGFETGTFTGVKKLAASVLAALGVPEAEKFATDAQIFQAKVQESVLQKQLEQKGVQTQADANRISETVASLGNTPNANRFLIAVAKEQLKRDIAQRNFYRAWRQKNKSFEGAEDAWYEGEGGKSLFDAPSLKRFGTPAAAPPAPAPAPAAAPPQKASSIQEQADAIIRGSKK